MKKRHIHQNIRLIQICVLARNALFVLPVLILYYKDQMGLSFQELVLGEVCFAATVLLMEIPSGWISDVWSRKRTLIIALAFEIVGWCILLGASDFWVMVLVQVFVGIGVSLFSGTDSALMYESLAEDDENDRFRAQIGKLSGLSFYSLAIAALIGGFLYKIDPYLPVYALIGCQFVALGAVLCIKEPQRVKKAIEKHPLHDMAITMHEAIIKRPRLGIIIVMAALIFASTQYGVWGQQAYWAEMNLSPEMFGVMAAIGWGLSGVTGHAGHVLEKFCGPRRLFIGFWLLVCVGWAIAGFHLGWLGVVGLFAGSIMWAVGWPALQDIIHRQIGSERRATVISSASLMIRIAFMPIGTIISGIADKNGVQESFQALLGLHIICGLMAMMIWLWAMKRKAKK